MTILTAPKKRRSNRALTTLAIDAAVQYLNGEDRRSWDYGNTRAFVDESRSLNVTLFGNQILKIIKRDDLVSEIQVFAGGVYDQDGNPTNLTRERLNGLLDALGAEGLIPENVRVWMDKEDSLCYLVHFDSKQVLNKHYCKMIGLATSSRDFQVVSRDIVIQHSC